MPAIVPAPAALIWLSEHPGPLRHPQLRHGQEGARLAGGAGRGYRFHDFKKQGVPAHGWTPGCALGWEKLLNRQGTTWRKLDPASAGQAPARRQGARALMLEQPSVIQRPVVEWPDGTVTVGFDPGRNGRCAPTPERYFFQRFTAALP